jgi:DNA (cytosine-5)-methyltransferase 1
VTRRGWRLEPSWFGCHQTHRTSRVTQVLDNHDRQATILETTMNHRAPGRKETAMTVAGLFAGIGGIEVGFHRAGFETELLCEIDPGASNVLKHRFPDVPLAADIRNVKGLPNVDVVAAGFPCQDLSQAGRTAGIGGTQSSVVGEVFRLLDSRRRGPQWLVLENVSFMLQLDRGTAMRYLADELELRGYSWAYRVVDTRAFGLPQRRQRVILIASKTEDPRTVLFADNAEPFEPGFTPKRWCGFYWTEGSRGLGWAVDAVPTLKGGSTIGIPSPPAIWKPEAGEIVTPGISDAERLQGFDADWTLPALEAPCVRRGHRWKLVGNAVSVPVAEWVGMRLAEPGTFDSSRTGGLLGRGVSWPKAAFGAKGEVYPIDVTLWPLRRKTQHLSDFLAYRLTPLSARAALGFYSRAIKARLRFQEGFLDAVHEHGQSMRTTLK